MKMKTLRAMSCSAFTYVIHNGYEWVYQINPNIIRFFPNPNQVEYKYDAIRYAGIATTPSTLCRKLLNI